MRGISLFLNAITYKSLKKCDIITLGIFVVVGQIVVLDTIKSKITGELGSDLISLSADTYAFVALHGE